LNGRAGRPDGVIDRQQYVRCGKERCALPAARPRPRGAFQMFVTFRVCIVSMPLWPGLDSRAAELR
ncbi:MAG TPA: hypothetical protein VII47_14775, partial [Actinomycetota bacterium]